MESKTIIPLDKVRLQSVAQFIEDHNYSWERLHAKLREEYNIERARLDDMNLNPYLNNLRQTIEKQATEYLNAPKKQKASAFRLFVEAFQQDVREAIGY